MHEENRISKLEAAAKAADSNKDDAPLTRLERAQIEWINTFGKIAWLDFDASRRESPRPDHHDKK